MRLATIGAFPFPYPQGSQVYVEEQARALRQAGAEPVLVTYSAGRFPSLRPSHQRARSGPSFAKPFADAVLTRRYLALHRRGPFDVALAHNGEAAVVAILARSFTKVPVIYVAHTILRYELSAYAPTAWSSLVDPVGAGIDRWIAQRADGIIALSDDARALLAADARGPIEVIPPGLAPDPAPSEEDQIDACSRAGVRRRRFVLYTGNLDTYQDLELLDAAAEQLPDDMPILVATHDARDGAVRFRNLRIAEQPTFAEVRKLAFAAGALVLTRRRPGGFPIKLLNYMETGRPIVAFARIAPGLEDGRNACLLPDASGPREIAEALHRLRDDPEHASALGAGARKHLEQHHAWPDLARRTLAFAERLG